MTSQSIITTVPATDSTTQDCPSCGTPAGHHCATWCELNGTSWDEME